MTVTVGCRHPVWDALTISRDRGACHENDPRPGVDLAYEKKLHARVYAQAAIGNSDVASAG